jgi:hypothetical protein
VLKRSKIKYPDRVDCHTNPQNQASKVQYRGYKENKKTQPIIRFIVGFDSLQVIKRYKQFLA